MTRYPRPPFIAAGMPERKGPIIVKSVAIVSGAIVAGVVFLMIAVTALGVLGVVATGGPVAPVKGTSYARSAPTLHPYAIVWPDGRSEVACLTSEDDFPNVYPNRKPLDIAPLSANVKCD
ncbi:hypothetical protein Lfu02_55100 [Longispora fulva]|uniref:Uncharacterized SAM-binding protein YcdF (DUF218 family) n=1 Tax=Longispora fulva TaxID=619741 RepID=A0A8J7KK10_9ACTN|nr:hypothetical protein [Longispora fulva]MBG6137509.1 uncharacterized SAM-binding protein YcdF (DUF218 family) [Longispora fulva]GIG61138.1 hypothetical protein Lfu02_55100 [Longispora fulva]